jgi:hypothetical protein
VDAPRDRLLSWLLADGSLPPAELTGAARTLWVRMQDAYLVRGPRVA